MNEHVRHLFNTFQWRRCSPIENGTPAPSHIRRIPCVGTGHRTKRNQPICDWGALVGPKSRLFVVSILAPAKQFPIYICRYRPIPIRTWLPAALRRALSSPYAKRTKRMDTDGCFLAANLLSNAIPLRCVHSLRIVFPLPTAVRNPIFSINCLAKTFSHLCRSKQQHSVLRLRVVFIQITNICHSPELVSSLLFSLLFYLSKLANLFEKQNKKKKWKKSNPKEIWQDDRMLCLSTWNSIFY